MNSYKEAGKVESQLSKLVEKHPITKGNANEWLAFTQVIISSLRLIRQEALGGGEH